MSKDNALYPAGFTLFLLGILLFIGYISARNLDGTKKEWVLKEEAQRNESTLIYTGVMVKARHFPKGLDNDDWWHLEFKDGPTILIVKSPYWFVPVGEEINVYRYTQKRKKGRNYYIERIK